MESIKSVKGLGFNRQEKFEVHCFYQGYEELEFGK